MSGAVDLVHVPAPRKIEGHESGGGTRKGPMWIAINGCMHGELDLLYAAVREAEDRAGVKVSLLISCGDFQATRNKTDLECLACPPKYRRLNDFHKYYSGESTAPVTTLFIGGNHEASNFMQELPCGGWVAPNIFYMGYACVVEFCGLRIGGMSGIFNARHYQTPHFERSPYTPNTLRSVYHIREIDVFRMGLLSSPKTDLNGGNDKDNSSDVVTSHSQRLDIFLSHDWPQGIALFGNVHQLVRKKPYFKGEIADGSLGSPPMAHLLHTLRPHFWFSAHLHVKFAAVVNHSSSLIPKPNDTQQFDPRQLSMRPQQPSRKEVELNENVTRFLALDKAIPGRRFLQLLEMSRQGSIEGKAAGNDSEHSTMGDENKSDDIANDLDRTSDASSSTPIIRFDEEWLAILRATYDMWGARNIDEAMIPSLRIKVKEAQSWLRAKAEALAKDGGGDLFVPHPFQRAESTSLQPQGNAQMDHFLNVIGCDHVLTIPLGRSSSNKDTTAPHSNNAPNIPLPLLHKSGPTLVPVSVLTSRIKSNYSDSLAGNYISQTTEIYSQVDPDEILLSDDESNASIQTNSASVRQSVEKKIELDTIEDPRADPDAIDIGDY